VAGHPLSNENSSESWTKRRSRSLNPFPRVAFLPDTFHEINGVAHTSRQLEAFAQRQKIPFLSIHCGPVLEACKAGSVSVLQLKRGSLAFGLDANLRCDPLLLRYAGAVMKAVQSFGAELIHITGPGDLGTLGAYVACRLNLPLVISWHTSLHEYAEHRVRGFLSCLGETISSQGAHLAEQLSLEILRWFYRRGRVLFAPNRELCDWLGKATGRPVYLMSRGVDTELFAPSRRQRFTGPFRIGYVGRLTPEKNVRFLAECGRSLLAAGHNHFEIELIGQGRESNWLAANVPNVVMRGVLVGEELARAYSDMDLFVFPSRTDTFGNVVLEALSSGVPALVTNEGGPRHIVKHGETGFVARSDDEFTGYVRYVFENRSSLERMRSGARGYATQQSWETVFREVFRGYAKCLNAAACETSNRHLARETAQPS
jgi:phosphatidylinositol alpha 1,6-mannosyltransferase